METKIKSNKTNINKKFKKIITNTRVIIFAILVILSLLAIRPWPFDRGVAIRSVAPNSSAALAGIISPKSTTPPMSREVIIAMNDRPIHSLDDYYSVIEETPINSTIIVITNKNKYGYALTVRPKYKRVYLNTTHIEHITEHKIVQEEVNGTLVNKSINVTINKTVRDYKDIIVGKDIGLRVYKAPRSNINWGIDLQGGVRVILKPANKSVDPSLIETTIESMKQRLNVYGLSDISVRQIKSLEGTYIVAEIPGINEEEVKELIAKQGKFEAKIGNYTVFIGGKDITYVCMRDPNCARLQRPIHTPDGSGYVAKFMFSISVTPEAAQRFAQATRNLDIVTGKDGKRYLSQKLLLYLDDKLVDELNIVADLKGQAVSEAAITGAGVGTTPQEAIQNARTNMKRLQTVLITGSLPIKLEIVNIETLSPSLGMDFMKNIALIGILALVAVSLVVYLRYRRLEISIPMIINVLGEVIILLGVATIIKWKLDIAALAGLIIAIGTGLDHQIIIADETLKGEKHAIVYGLKEKIKRAFFIILGSFFTTTAAMIPLTLIGANLLKGFAFTTILGLMIGVFITRPTYAKIIEILLRE